jgi:hypothetical protein
MHGRGFRCKACKHRILARGMQSELRRAGDARQLHVTFDLRAHVQTISLVDASVDASSSVSDARMYRMSPSTAVCKGTSCAYSQRRQICKLLKCSGICIWHCAVPSVCAHLRFVDNGGRGSGDRRYGIRTCSNRVAPASFSEQTFLASMYIEDFVLVRKQSVRFGTGMNVISGQSGSGKSVLLNAFNVVLGMQASSDMVRSPADVAGKVSFAGMSSFGARAHNIQRVHTNFRWRTGAIVGSAQRNMGTNYAVVHDNVWYGVVQTTTSFLPYIRTETR